MPAYTDQEIKSNRPDIIIKDQELKKCLLIDMTIPAERYTSVKMIEKLSKHKDLKIEIFFRMWGLKTEAVPVVIGALGRVKKGLGEYVEKIPGNINIEELQKISLLGTAHILRKVQSTN